MNAHLTEQLVKLFGARSSHFKNGISAWALQFEIIGNLAAGQKVWDLGESKPVLYFNSNATLAEYSDQFGTTVCHRIIPPMTLFWSESSFILGNTCDTKMLCKQAGTIYGISGEQVKQITERFGMGFHMAINLTARDIGNYRKRSTDLCLLKPTDRLQKTLDSNQQILSQISREELAKYLGLSRSSLFRAINTLHDVK